MINMALIIIIAAFFVADIYSTYRALRVGCVERFWLAKYAMQRLGVLPGLAFIKGLVLGVLVWIAYVAPEAFQIAFLPIVVGYMWVIRNNCQEIQKQKGL